MADSVETVTLPRVTIRCCCTLLATGISEILLGCWFWEFFTAQKTRCKIIWAKGTLMSQEYSRMIWLWRW